MTYQFQPKATEKEFLKKEEYEQKAKAGTLSEQEEAEYLGFLNSYDWSVTIFPEDGKYGITSATGKILVPAAYDEFICELSVVEYLKIVVAAKSGKYGLVRADGTGEEITAFIYDFMAPWLGQATGARTGNTWNYITQDGEKLIPFDLDRILFPFPYLTFENGISVFVCNGLYGVTDGYSYSNPVFDEIDDLEPGKLVTGKQNGIKGYINIMGEFTTDEELAWFSTTDC